MAFDLDGTLVDSAKIVSSILNDLRSELGKPRIDVNSYVPWLSLGGIDLVANGLGVDRERSKLYLDEFRRRYASLSTPLDSVYEGVEVLLNHLVGQKKHLCVCTNKPRNLAEKVLHDTGLYQYFTFMCAGGDLHTQKPCPENLDICIKHFGVSYDETILVGDSQVDQTLAATLGVDFACFTHGYNDGIDESRAPFSFSKHIELRNFLIRGN